MRTKADVLELREPGTGKLARAAGVCEGAGAPWERSGPSTVSWSSRLRVEPPVLLGQTQAGLLKAPSLRPSCLRQHLDSGPLPLHCAGATGPRPPPAAAGLGPSPRSWTGPVPRHARAHSRAHRVKVCAATRRGAGLRMDDPSRRLPFSCDLILSRKTNYL